ncbi:MAG TPA: nuclease-related domain-containing protein [Anaerolineae bacterium]
MAQSYTNDQAVKRRNKIGGYVSLASLAFLAIGAYFVVTSLFNQNAELVLSLVPNAEPFRVNYILLAYAMMFLAIGITSFGSRFMTYQRLRPENKLSLALKGLDKNHRLYSYTLPFPFVLLTPFAVYALLVKPQEGNIIVKGDKWSHGFSLMRLVRFFAIEPLGDPVRELSEQKDKLTKWLATELPNVTVPVDGYVVFLDPNARVALDNPTVAPILLNQDPDALKNALRRDKRTNMPAGIFKQVADLFARHATGEEDE